MRRWLVVLGFGLMVLPLAAQRGGRRVDINPLIPDRYDGRFVLARLYYGVYPGWSYDWPDMEDHLNQIVGNISTLRTQPRRNNVLRMDDPELFKYPVAYLSEPGYWFPTDSEVRGLQEWLNKGGFLIVDDFHFAEEWLVFERAMTRVLPSARIERLDIKHPVFNSFFPIMSLRVPYPGRLGEQGLMGEFFGIHDDNAATSRLMVVINYNMDIGDYMEYTPGSRYDVAPTNEAYKFGINYLIYGLTH